MYKVALTLLLLISVSASTSTFAQKQLGSMKVGLKLVSPDNGQKTVKIDNLQAAIDQMHGFCMRFKAGCRGDGLPDPDVIRRDEIARVLRSNGRQSVKALAKELTSPDLSMRKNASFELLELADALGEPFHQGKKVDITAAVPALIMALNDTDDEVRIWSMAALASLGPAAKDALPELTKLTHDKDQGIRFNARARLAEIQGLHKGKTK